VLLVTLGLLVLSSTLLVAVGRLAVQRSLAARVEQDALQRRWGAISCRTALLPSADEILTRAGRASASAIPIYRAAVPLGNQTFEVVIGDEQAKANVNAMIDAADAATAANRLRAGLSGTGTVGAVVLRPSYLISAEPTATSRPAGPTPWITGPGQIFDLLPPERLVHGVAGVGSSSSSSPLDRITCWGDGAINLMRADAAAMRLALTPELSGLEIDRIIEARAAMLKSTSPKRSAASVQGGPPPPPADADIVTRILYEAKVNPKHRAKLALSGVSKCHSLWVIARDRQRSWYWLFVNDQANPQRPRMEFFEW
jgi:hypothetical protein